MLDLPDAAGWDAWLAAHHDEETEAWLRLAKKRAPVTSLTMEEAIEVALCWGWIDGQRRGHDDVSYLQRFSPRRPRSSWSQVNVARVEALVAAGRMRPPGLAQVDAAKADGRWDAAYEAQSTAQVPPDLADALARDDRARAAFEALGRSDRYQVLLPLLKARDTAERERRLARALQRLRAGQA